MHQDEIIMDNTKKLSSNYSNYIYTDGSKKNYTVGCSVIIDSNIIKYQLASLHTISNFIAEYYATITPIDHIAELIKKNPYIYGLSNFN